MRPLSLESTFLKYAKIAQLVERHLAKVEVAGSNPVFRSVKSRLIVGSIFASPIVSRSGGIGRHVGLKIQWAVMPVRVQVPPSVQISKNRIGRFGFFIPKTKESLLSEG